jgi:hypothetical protein
MGSNLSKNKNKYGLIRSAVFGGLTDLEQIEDKTISATSLIKTSYKQLADRLLNSYDVIIYPLTGEDN